MSTAPAVGPPICPKHGLPMKVSRFGGWHCTSLDTTQPKGYCDQKVKAAPPTSIGAPPLPQAGPVPLYHIPGYPNGESLAAAALGMVGRMYAGSLGSGSSDADREFIKRDASEFAMRLIAATKACL